MTLLHFGLRINSNTNKHLENAEDFYEDLQRLSPERFKELVPEGKVTPDIIYNAPLTYEKVLLAQKYQKYANDFFKSTQLNDGVKLVPVSYHKMTGIILEQVTQLQSADKERLEVISSKKKMSLEDSLKVNELYSKNYDSIFYLVDFEQAHNLANLIQNPEMIDFLDANYLIQQAALLTITQKLVLFDHIKKKLKHENILNSLSERIHIQTKDSVAIKKLMAYDAPIEKPSEVTDGIYISNSDEKGHKWLNNVLQSYKGKTVYLVKWSINDPENLQKLQNIAYLRSVLPENVVFLFIHLVKNELDSHLIPLAKQNILVQHLEGTHLFPTPNQIAEMKLRIPPLESDTYLIIKPNGKVLKTKTPSLDDVNLLTSVLLHAAE